MSRYIDADKLMEQVTKKKPEVAKARYAEGFNDAIMRVRSMIHSASTVDVVEVRHGHWGFDGLGWTCSECGEYALTNKSKMQAHSVWCPHCGAKMDGESKEVNYDIL